MNKNTVILTDKNEFSTEEIYTKTFYCSNCNDINVLPESKYCSNCGFKIIWDLDSEDFKQEALQFWKENQHIVKYIDNWIDFKVLKIYNNDDIFKIVKSKFDIEINKKYLEYLKLF